MVAKKDNIFSDIDLKFMNLAINLARKNVGKTLENPSVGCVIVKDNVILSTGITGVGGRPHAENVAISKAKKDLSGATLYVTLEPCFHFGKTNPCVDLIISKNISRVVIGSQDPDDRVNGKSISKLLRNNIEVDFGLLENEVKKVCRGFFKAKTLKQPFVTLKLATSLDNKTAKKGDSRVWVTNEQSRKFGHYLRAKNDAILIGANTVRIDNPTLDCRIDGLEEFSPIRIVLSENLNLNLKSNIFQNQKLQKTYIATKSKDKSKIIKFEESGIEVIRINNQKELLNILADKGVNSLLIEGGANASAAFIKEDLVDEIVHFKGNEVLGEGAVSAIAGLEISDVICELKFEKTLQKTLCCDSLTVFSKKVS